MPAPTTVQEFLGLVQRSGVLEESRLRAALHQLQANGTALPADPSQLAGLLVSAGHLTYFQAEQFLQGKWKRFTIGKYKVLERIGSGGMGQVFLCEHKLMRRRVAVKVLPTAKADDPAALERFYREARAVAALDHPNIVRAYDIDQDEKLHFLVMEYVDGTNLHDLVKKIGPVSVLHACHYVRQSAIGLQAAFDTAGLIHRDIKPANVLIDRQGWVKILDMGLARFFHDEEDNLTRANDETVLGTADYLSPEQAVDSHTVDIRTDIYSLGATFYYLLTGFPPFPDGSVANKLIWHQTKEPKSIKSYRQDVPPAVMALVVKMMAKLPDERYQMPSEVAVALEPYTTTPIGPPPEEWMPKLSLAAQAPTFKSEGPERTQVQRPGNPGSSVTMPAVKSVPATPPPAPRPAPVPAPQARPGGSSFNAPALRPGGGTAVAQPRAEATVSPDDNPASFWENLAAETSAPAATREIPARAAPAPAAAPTPAPTAPVSKKPFPWLLTVGGGLIVLSVAAIGGWFYFKPPTTPAVPGQPAARKPLAVHAAGADGAYRTLALAYEAAQSGDRIIVRSAEIEESLVLDAAKGAIVKNVAIEAGATQARVIWKAPKSVNAATSVLYVNGVEGLTVRGFDMDGQGIGTCVRLTGRCPGLTLENVSIFNCKTCGISLGNCAGDANQPVTFNRVSVRDLEGAAEALHLFTSPAIKATPENRAIVFRKCEFQAHNVVVRIEGRNAEVEFSDNRIGPGKVGFQFESATPTTPPTGKLSAFRLTNNQITTQTAANIDAAKSFDAAAQQAVVSAGNKLDGAAEGSLKLAAK